MQCTPGVGTGFGCSGKVSFISWVAVFLWKEGLEAIFQRARERWRKAFELVYGTETPELAPAELMWP